MKKVVITKNQVSDIQSESDFYKRDKLIGECEKILYTDYSIDDLFVNMQHDILLVAQTAYTREVRFPSIKNKKEFDEIIKLFTEAGYEVYEGDDKKCFFIKF